MAEDTVGALSRSLSSLQPYHVKEGSFQEQLIAPMADDKLAEKWDWICAPKNGVPCKRDSHEVCSVPNEFSSYSGPRQSPVSIDSSATVPWTFPPIEFKHHWNNKASINLTNTGTSVQMSFVPEDVCPGSGPVPCLSGGPLSAEYEFVQMHFHWGNENHLGCEHIIDGERYAMEAHLVHYNKAYGSVAEAFKHPDGLAVVGIFLQVGMKENEDLHMLVSSVKDVCVEKGKCTVLTEEKPLFWIKEVVEAHCGQSSSGGGGYYTYLGSLTTPNYDENVTWILFPSPAHISTKQIEEFRQLMSPEGRVKENFRSCQPIDDRRIYLAD